MKKLIITLVAAIIATASSFAQNTTVKGIVLDSLTRDAECYATIQFFNTKNTSNPAAFTVTDDEGRFEQKLSRGDYELLFSSIGRQEKRIAFTVAKEDVDLGEILVCDDVLTLAGSKVIAQKEIVKMDVDRISYSVEDDSDSETSSVLDMLRKVPMVTVDGSDNITVNGSRSFQVYVDGKPSQMLSSNPSQAFKAMPASIVKNIEVVTNPGARYDAEGVGGVLNITTNSAAGSKALADGIYANIGAMGSNRGVMGNGYFSLQKGKFNMGLNASETYLALNHTTNEYERIQETANGQMTTSSLSDTDMKVRATMANLTLGYEIDSLNLFSATAGVLGIHTGTNQENDVNMALAGADYYSSYTSLSNSSGNNSTITASADFQHTWKNCKDRNIIVSYQFSGSPDKSKTVTSMDGYYVPGVPLSDRKQNTKRNSFSHTVQTDFTTPVGKGQNLSAGVKAILRHNLSNDANYLLVNDDYVLNSVMDYNYYNRIGGAYAEYQGQFGCFGIRAGLRYEHTWQNVTYGEGQGTDFKINYGDLIPSASMQFNIGTKQNIGLAYNMRISRPGITYLNPYVDDTEPTTLSYGNTNLDVEKGHNVSLVYNYTSSKFITSLTLKETYTGNGISSYSFIDGNGIINNTYGNVVKSAVTGLSAYMMYMPTYSTRIILNGGLNYSLLSSEALAQSNKGLGYNAMVNFQQTLPWELKLGAMVLYSGKSVNIQGWSTGMSLGTLSLSKSFFDNSLDISIRGVGGFTKGLNLTSKSYSKGADFQSSNKSSIPMGQIAVAISYSFGKKFNVKSVNTNRDSEVIDIQSQSKSLTGMVGM